jgi:UDPglucose 6-dehydrogenase
MQKLYKPFVLNGHPILFMDIPSAELTKYAANSMLATKISFINDIANLCELVGADINMVRKGIGSDPRIGYKFIYAGIGYGGSCFPKDVKALIKTAEENDYSLRLLKSVDEINNTQKMVLVEKVRKYFKNNLKGKNIAIWGLSYKPNTDDMRESPSIVIINQLLDEKAKIKVYDPVAMDEGKKIFNDKIEFGNDAYAILNGADALLLVTEWAEFRIPDFKLMEILMNEKVIFDGRNIYDPVEIRENGFKYFGIGRKI